MKRTVVVVHSISFEVPDQLIPVFPAYEERFLCLVLSLLRAPASRVVYVTSSPIHARVVDYYFSLVPELDTPQARSRFETVSLVDGRNEPLSRKLLARPGAIERIARLIGEPEVGMIIPFCMTADEVGVAEALQLPIYGCDPALGWLGSKTGAGGSSRTRTSVTRSDSTSRDRTISRTPSASCGPGALRRGRRS